MSNSSILSTIQKLRSLLNRKEKIKILGIAVFALCSSLLELLTASAIVIFTQILNQPELGKKYFLKAGFENQLSSARIIVHLSIGIGIIYLIKNLLATAEVFYQNFSIQKMNYHFKNKLLYRYAEIDYGLYLTRNSSWGMQVINGDTDQIFSAGMTALANILSEGMIFLFLILMIIYMNPILALIIFVIGFIFSLIISKKLLPLFYKWGQHLQEASLHSSRNLLQFFHAFKEIILLGKKSTFIDTYQYYSLRKSHIQAMQMAINALPRLVLEVFFVGLFVLTIVFLCSKHESPVHMIGILGGYLYAGFRLMPGLNRIINQLNNFKAIVPSIERVYEEYHNISLKENYIDIPDLKFEESINFNNISFHYLNTNKDALKNVNLEIKKGERIGIIGETGSGKSTFVDLILGLLKPYEGSILVDGKYIVNSYQWHQKIGYVPQSVYLIDDTIEANIAFGEKKIDFTRLRMAINAAQLSKFVNQLPEGFKTIVGERGMRLSGGERQRISIARALYRNPEILIFDEATSALDNETEAKLMETINTLSKNRTVIMIAHRLSTLKNCDQIIKVEKGMITAVMKFQEMIQKEKKGKHA